MQDPSKELYEETFGSAGDDADPGAPGPADRSLEYIDPRDGKLAVWLGGIDLMLVRVGKGWLLAFEVLILAALIAFAAAGVLVGIAAMLLILCALGIYQIVNLPYWIAEHNAAVAARRADASTRKDA